MQPEEKDAAFLWDMREAAREIQRFTESVQPKDYFNNRLLQLAVERELEIIGEAARKVSDALRNAHPEIPWSAIISQRNILAHEYGKIDHQKIWMVVEKNIPELISSLDMLIPPLPPEVEE